MGVITTTDFSNKLVNDYLKSISETGIRYVELGFRSLSKKEFKGPNWYTTDSYINHLTIPKIKNRCYGQHVRVCLKKHRIKKR